MPKIINMERVRTDSEWYNQAIERLIWVAQDLSQAHDIASIANIVREAARNLTGADGATFVLRKGNLCYYLEENAISPLWKGRLFPMEACISGWVMLNGQTAVIPDIYKDSRIPVDAYRPTFVKSLVMVPIRRNNPMGAIGNYWATHRTPSLEEISILQTLADTTSVALENAQLYGELQTQLAVLQQQDIRIQEQHHTLEIFTRALAHDLKEPLRTIRAFIELLMQQDLPLEKSQYYFDYVQNAAKRMDTLVNTVSHYMQLDDPELTVKKLCSMNHILHMVKDNLSFLINHKKAIITADELPEISADPIHMMQLLQNLVSNAIHHNDQAIKIHISAVEETDNWRFSVCDNGVGIASEYQDKIFHPFKRLTAQENCTGLGLTICQKIVEIHGGKIWCHSVEKQKTIFNFTLPKIKNVKKTKQIQQNDEAPLNHATQQQLMLANILLIDDSESDIELMKILLQQRIKLQCHLSIAHSAEEGLNILQQKINDGGNVDLILLDINMPKMNGFELLEYFRSKPDLEHLAVIMCSGSTYIKDQQRAQELGAAGYLEKPLSFNTFQSAVNQIKTLQLINQQNNNSLLRVVH